MQVTNDRQGLKPRKTGFKIQKMTVFCCFWQQKVTPFLTKWRLLFPADNCSLTNTQIFRNPGRGSSVLHTKLKLFSLVFLYHFLNHRIITFVKQKHLFKQTTQGKWSMVFFILGFYSPTISKAGWNTCWNQDCQERHQQSHICRWHHHYVRKQRGTKEPPDEKSKRRMKKLA